MQAEAGPGFLLTLCTIVVWMKLVSYAHCNSDLRAARRLGQLRSGERGSPEAPSWALLQYPENLTAGNMLFFLAVPTLVYQVGSPGSL
jgi:diacylglycerol O-acyltransferase-1